MDTIKKFYEALASDNAMQERAGKLSEKYSDAAPDEATIAAEIMAFAKSEGYEFTAEELKAYTGDTAKELPDEELAAVAGGEFGSCFCALGGGGKDGETGIICSCVMGGGGKKDKEGNFLGCVVLGALSF